MATWMRWQQMMLACLGTGLISGDVVLQTPPSNAEPFQIAQVIPDASLGAEQSNISPTGIISGGAARGANLFHSFSIFNVRNGESIYFANPAGIDRIVSRVTGNTRSEILGTLGVLGNADLFLLNPNGIIFGANARLDLRGSFIGSTATSLVFGDGFVFSAAAPQAPPLLAINVPIGLQYGNNPGGIEVQGANLQAGDGKTLALLGGAVTLDHATLNATGGHIELSGLAAPGAVDLIPGNPVTVGVPETLPRADVTLINQSTVTMTAAAGGSITVNAGTINLSDQSTLRILATQPGQGYAGTLTVNATNVTITSGGQLLTETSSDNRGGDIRVNVRDRLTLDGDNTGLFANTTSMASGDGGDVFVTANQIIVRNGAGLGVDSFSPVGEGGDIDVTANLVRLDQRSSIATEVKSRAGGDINLRVDGLLLLRQDSILSTEVGDPANPGNGGNLTVNARFIIVPPVENSDVSANSFLGRGGAIALSADTILGLIARSRADLERLIGEPLDPTRLPTNDVTSISLNNPTVRDGAISLQSKFNPTQGELELPANFSTLPLAQGCRSRTSRTGSFVITGQGGVAVNPVDALAADAIWQDVNPIAMNESFTIQNSLRFEHSESRTKVKIESAIAPITEAQGWVILPNGTISLTAESATGLFSVIGHAEIGCLPNYKR